MARPRLGHDAAVCELLRAGMTAPDIERATDISCSLVRAIAKRNGIVPKHGVGRNTKKRPRQVTEKPAPPMNVAPSGKWTAMKRQYSWDEGAWL